MDALQETRAKGEAGSAGMRSGVPAAASVSARTTMRRASSILKALSPDGLASASAASAAPAKASRVGRDARQQQLPRPRARQGFAATPPSASRASAIVPPSIRSAAAAETTAKA